MLFQALLVLLVLLTIGASIAGYHSKPYNQPDNAWFAGFMTLIFGGMLSALVILGCASAAGDDPNNHEVTSEKTYTLAENSVPKVDGAKGELEFSYVEDGQVSVFKEYVSPFTIGMEKPKALKITHYDTVDHSIIPWVIDDTTTVEVIK